MKFSIKKDHSLAWIGFFLTALPLTAQDTDHDGLTDAWERGLGRYEIIPGRFSWGTAKADAEQRGGHLATVINAQEWADIKAVLGTQLNGKNLWLGGTDDGTEGNWRWVTGEKWSFTHWRTNEPGNNSLNNGQGTPENYLMIWGHETENQDGHEFYWNDATLSGGSLTQDGYVFERGSWSDPIDPDTDDDGLSDGEETRSSVYEIIHVASPPGMTWEEANT
jgi:Lectin C-type domain